METNTYQFEMLLAMNRLGKHIYEGSVSPVEVQRRRNKNKVARRQRKVNKGIR